MKKLSAFWFILWTGIVFGCNSGKSSEHGKEVVQFHTTMRFKTFHYIDQQGIGIEAFQMLIPTDWNFEGGIRWVMDCPAMPAVGSFRVTSPSGLEELEGFPSQIFFWTDDQWTLSMVPMGTKYFGAEVRPPARPLEVLKNIIVPRYRGNFAGLRIVAETPLPDLAKQLSLGQQSYPGITTSADAGKVKIQYKRNERWMEEEIFVVVETSSYPFQSMYGVVNFTNWVVEYLISFKAEKGKLESNAKIFQTMVNSFKINPQWFNKYMQVSNYLVQNQIQQIRNVGQLSRIISQTSNEISDMIMSSWQERQTVYDRITTNFSQYIRGVDEYYDPIKQQSIELPSGYQQAWTNALGEYILSDDPNFNPNIGSTQNWERMKKRQ